MADLVAADAATSRQTAAKPASAGRRDPSPNSHSWTRASGPRSLRGAPARLASASAPASARTVAISSATEARGRLDLTDRRGHEIRRRAQPEQALAAGGAAGQVPLELGGLAGVERAERVSREIVVPLGAAAA